MVACFFWVFLAFLRRVLGNRSVENESKATYPLSLTLNCNAHIRFQTHIDFTKELYFCDCDPGSQVLLHISWTLFGSPLEAIFFWVFLGIHRRVSGDEEKKNGQRRQILSISLTVAIINAGPYPYCCHRKRCYLEKATDPLGLS